MQNFLVHSNESACRKIERLGMDQFIKQRQSEWKGGLKYAQKVGKGLSKVF